MRQEWYTEPSDPTSAPSSLQQPPEDNIFSPTRTGKTPLPVIANWFDKLESALSQDTVTTNEEDSNVTIEQLDSKTTTNNNVIEETCGNVTKDMLNEMFDSLVSEQQTIEILEASSGETETMKRKKSEKLNSELVAESSAESDSNSKENKDILLHDDNNQSVIIAAPQTPKEIRKKFQQSSSFEKNIVKSTEIEFSPEFREGIKGKVKESKESFLKQVVADQKKIDAQSKVKDEIFKSQSMSQEEIPEYKSEGEQSNISKSTLLLKEDTDSVQSSYQQEKQARKLELLQLINRSGPSESVSESGKRDLQIREERNKELAELVNRRTDVDMNVEDKTKALKEERSQELYLLSNRRSENEMECTVDKTTALKEERRKELEELANRKVDFDWSCDTKEKAIKEERAKELYDIANRKAINNETYTMDVKGDEKLRQERAEELKQISLMRSQSSFETTEDNKEVKKSQTINDDLVTDTSSLRGKVRNTAAMWKEREKSGSRDKEPSIEKDTNNKDAPTRRIGSLFKHDPDYWNLNEPEESELPPPPTELTEISQTIINPPPPPRQSSRSKMEEYSRDPGWSAPWRKS